MGGAFALTILCEARSVYSRLRWQSCGRPSPVALRRQWTKLELVYAKRSLVVPRAVARVGSGWHMFAVTVWWRRCAHLRVFSFDTDLFGDSFLRFFFRGSIFCAWCLSCLVHIGKFAPISWIFFAYSDCIVFLPTIQAGIWIVN